MDEGDEDGLGISTGLIRHPDGTFGVWARASVSGRTDVEPVESVLEDAHGLPASFPSEREAQLAAFDWIADMRRNAENTPPPGSTGVSGAIERADELSNPDSPEE